MGHKNRDKFFNDPFAIQPQTGQLLYIRRPRRLRAAPPLKSKAQSKRV
jgi:hypothetical protein